MSQSCMHIKSLYTNVSCTFLFFPLQYKPPQVRRRSGVTPAHNPPGSSVVMRRTNFAGTYTLDKGSPPYGAHQEPSPGRPQPIVTSRAHGNPPPFQTKSPTKTSSFGGSEHVITSPTRGALQARQTSGATAEPPPQESTGGRVARRTSYTKRGPAVPKCPIMGGVAGERHEQVLARRASGGDVFYEHSAVDGIGNGVFTSDVIQNGGHVAYQTRGKRPPENGGLARGGSLSSTSSSEHDLPPLETRYPGRSRHPKRYDYR